MNVDDINTIVFEYGLEDDNSSYFSIHKDGSYEQAEMFGILDQSSAPTEQGKALFNGLIEVLDREWFEKLDVYEALDHFKAYRQETFKQGGYANHCTPRDAYSTYFFDGTQYRAHLDIPTDPHAAQIPSAGTWYGVQLTKLISDLFINPVSTINSVSPSVDVAAKNVDGDWNFYFRNSRFLMPIVFCFIAVLLLGLFLM